MLLLLLPTPSFPCTTSFCYSSSACRLTVLVVVVVISVAQRLCLRLCNRLVIVVLFCSGHHPLSRVSVSSSVRSGQTLAIRPRCCSTSLGYPSLFVVASVPVALALALRPCPSVRPWSLFKPFRYCRFVWPLRPNRSNASHQWHPPHANKHASHLMSCTTPL